MKRSLRLRRESLDELTVEQLGGVDGAAPPTLNDCHLTEPCTFGYNSCRQCITHPPCTD